MKNRKQDNAPVTSTTTAADPRPIQTTHVRSCFENDIFLTVLYINGAVSSKDWYVEKYV